MRLTRATIDACQRAGAHGATHALVRPPTSYTRFMTQDVLMAHYERVADASPIPVLLYNQPAVFGADLAAPTVAILSRHDNIVGLKDSSGNIAHVSDVLGRVPDGFSVLTGVAGMMYQALLSGTSGSIVAVANVVPNLIVQLYEYVMTGELHKALALQRAVAPLAKAVTVQYGVAGLKAAMTLAGYAGSSPRLPLDPVPPAVVDELRGLLLHLESFTGWTLLGRSWPARCPGSGGGVVRRNVLATCVVALATLAQAQGVAQPSTPAPTRELRVLTFNIHHAEGTDAKIHVARIAQLIKDSRADRGPSGGRSWR